LSPFLPDDAEFAGISSEELFKRYIQRLHPLSEIEFENTMKSVIHGDTRILAAKMSIDAMNDSREEFKREVMDKIQIQLLPYGIRIDTANIEDIHEPPRGDGSMGYLQARERKKLSDAVQQSEIDVAEATKRGDIGKKEREATTRQAKAALEAETQRIENLSKEKIAETNANLAVVQALATKRTQLSQIEATAETALQKEVLQVAIEQKKGLQQLEAQRAERVTKAQIDKDCLVLTNEADKQAKTLQAEANERFAEAERFAAEQKAIGVFANLKAHADGEEALLFARARGTRQLSESCAPEVLVPILAIQNGLPQKVAEETAKAVQGLQPQIWSLSGEDPHTAIARMITGFSPLVDVVSKLLPKK
jgi:flotillin